MLNLRKSLLVITLFAISSSYSMDCFDRLKELTKNTITCSTKLVLGCIPAAIGTAVLFGCVERSIEFYPKPEDMNKRYPLIVVAFIPFLMSLHASSKLLEMLFPNENEIKVS